MSVYHLACRWLDSAPSLDVLRDYGACIASLRPRLSEAEQAMLRGAYEHNEGRLRGWIQRLSPKPKSA